LEVPVAVIACLLLLKQMALPYKLVSCFPQARDTQAARAMSAAALSRALGQWRRADFTAGQRQALSTSSTDKLRDYLMDSGQDKYRAGLAALDDQQGELAEQRMTRQQEARRAKNEALSHHGDRPERSAARRGAIAGAILGIIPGVIMTLTSQPGLSEGEPISAFLSGVAWTLFQWPAIGWFVGYYRPLLRGRNGTEKACFLAVIAIVVNLPATIVWDSRTALAYDFTSYLEMLVFLVLVSVYACDLLTLKEAGFRFTDWPQVHNWRFVVTWSTALVAAIGTATVTFLTVATTDLANNTFNPHTSQSSSTSSPPTPSGSGN
jgi:hypothetical protein